MASSLLNPLDNVAEEIITLDAKIPIFFLEYESVKDYLIKYKYLSCNKDYSNKFDEELKNRLGKTF